MPAQADGARELYRLKEKISGICGWLVFKLKIVDLFLLRLTKQSFEIKYNPLAEVAELADALGSGLSERKLVRVQVPPSALPVAGQKLAKRRVFCYPTIPIFQWKITWLPHQ
jgi:hypothetical protein